MLEECGEGGRPEGGLDGGCRLATLRKGYCHMLVFLIAVSVWIMMTFCVEHNKGRHPEFKDCRLYKYSAAN